MKGRLHFLLYMLLFIASSKNAQAKNAAWDRYPTLFFIENKGQIKDQSGHRRDDIQYSIQTPGMTIFIGNGALHYQFSKREDCSGSDMPELLKKCSGDKAPQTDVILKNQASGFETYRLDVALTAANSASEITEEEPVDYYEHYYLPNCPESGLHAHACRKITYKNVYPDIDWVLYFNGDKLEQEFIVRSGADASAISMKYNGQTALKTNEDGSLTAFTPLGTIKEHAPELITAEGERIVSSYKLAGNEVSYNIKGYEGALVIDPVLEWGTYYGPGLSNTYFYDIICDNSANIFGCGLTYSTISATIATTGAFQTTINGSTDAYLVKFDSSGHRLWGTYYGGESGDWGTAIALDNLGNIYTGGSTSSTTVIATPGCEMPVFIGGLWVGFFAKFNAAGYRQWSTYVGGSAGPGFDLEIASVICDSMGHVYVSGGTDDTSNISTPGSFKPKKFYGVDTIDDYLIQYDTLNGHRIWGTYYGGPRNELTGVSCTDGGNIYLAGYTASDTGTGLAPFGTGISTPSSYHPLYGGGTDAFLAKFNSFGIREWGTYFGGSGAESVGGIAFSPAAGIYLLGATGSDTGIATPGSYQPTRSGYSDAFLTLFNPDIGAPIWSTYYGGPLDENTEFSRIACDGNGNVYICGYTSSTTGIASPGSWQVTYGGGDFDAFFAKYNNSGIQKWGTYYGGELRDDAYACAFDGKSLYLCGSTNSTVNIATPGSFLSSGGGSLLYTQGFLAKFNDPDLTLETKYSGQSGAGNFSIYPVPSKKTVTLTGSKIHKDGKVQLIITDCSGRIIMQDEVEILNGSLNKQISLNNNVPPGAYSLKIISQEEVEVLKILKD